ncbi:MAG TPA: DUF4198 domain-containing protein [Steroidobacteraceae bacterium]|nr:DUF4198 domain-containing protein [Steroidobacteraceae bacterium]
MKRLVLAITLGLAAAPAGAHDVTIWPEQSAEPVQLKLRLGDPGDYVRIDKTHCAELVVSDSKGVKIDFRRDLEALDDKTLGTPNLRLGDWPSGTYVVSGRYDNGLYVHDAENRAIATTKEWYPDSIDSAHYLKFSKAMFHIGASTGGFDRVVGHRLEFVPLADPFAEKGTATLPVKVLFDGMPLTAHIVEVGDETASSKGPRVTTDLNGIVQVKLDHKGWYRLAVDHRAPSKYPELFAFDDYTASLVFRR